MDEVMKPIVCILANFIINGLLKKNLKRIDANWGLVGVTNASPLGINWTHLNPTCGYGNGESQLLVIDEPVEYEK